MLTIDDLVSDAAARRLIANRNGMGGNRNPNRIAKDMLKGVDPKKLAWNQDTVVPADLRRKKAPAEERKEVK